MITIPIITTMPATNTCNNDDGACGSLIPPTQKPIPSPVQNATKTSKNMLIILKQLLFYYFQIKVQLTGCRAIKLHSHNAYIITYISSNCQYARNVSIPWKHLYPKGMLKNMAYSLNPFLPRVRMSAVLLVRKGWSVRQTARYIGVSPGTISK